MSYRTIEAAMRASEKSGYKLFYPECGEKVETRLYKGRYFIISCNYDGPEWRVRETLSPGGGSMAATFCTHRSFAEALSALRWLIQDDAHREAGTGFYAGLGKAKRTREAKKPRRSRSRAFDETAHYRCLG